MKKTFYKSAALLLAALFLSSASIYYFQPILTVHPLLIIAGVLIYFALNWYIYPFAIEISHWKRSKRISLYVFLPLFSIMTIFSLRGEQLFLANVHILIFIFVYLGMFLAVTVAVLAIVRVFLSWMPSTEQRHVSPFHVFLFMLPILSASMFLFIAFYPAGMTPDSLSQWAQAKDREFSDWHPVMFTWTIMFLMKFWDSPGVVVLFQIALLSLTMGYMGFLMKRFKVHSAIIWGVLVIAALMPTTAIFSIIIWKDVTYSISLLFFSLMIFLLVKTNGEESKKTSFIILFFISSFVLVFFRHNGFPVFLITMFFAILMYRHAWKRLIPVAFAIIVIHQVITGPVYTKLEVEPSDPQEALSIPTQQIANIVVNEGNMTEAQREYINRLMPMELWKEKYNPYAVDPIKFAWNDYDRSVIYDDWLGYFRIWGQLVLQNPGLALEAMLKETSLVWQINQPEDGYTSRYVTNIYLNNGLGLVNEVIQPDVKETAFNYLEVDTAAEEFIWRPAVYTFLVVLLFFIAYLRNDWRVWLILLPLALNTAAVTAAIPAQDFRYLYSNVLLFYAAIFIGLMSFVPKGGGFIEKS